MSDPDSAAVMATAAYRDFVRARRRLVWPLAGALFGLLMVLTALTVFTTWLDGMIVPGLNGSILAAYVVFFAPVAAAYAYTRRAERLDELARRAVDDARGLADGGAR